MSYLMEWLNLISHEAGRHQSHARCDKDLTSCSIVGVCRDNKACMHTLAGTDQAVAQRAANGTALKSMNYMDRSAGKTAPLAWTQGPVR